MDIRKKLEILAGAAKYDVSCASSGSRRENRGGRLGNTAASGICHSFTEDGRCVSLLKILFTNYCVYDVFYHQNGQIELDTVFLRHQAGNGDIRIDARSGSGLSEFEPDPLDLMFIFCGTV